MFRQTNRQLLGIAEYPFNRATRLEFAGGLRSMAFDRELNTSFVSTQTGQLLDERSCDLDAPETINPAQATAAFVYDARHRHRLDSRQRSSFGGRERKFVSYPAPGPVSG